MTECEYFFCCDANAEHTCENCIYSDIEFCPADLEEHKLICDDWQD